MKSEHSIAGIDYTLVRNRGQRCLRVHMDSNGHPVVSAPYGTSQRDIDEFVTNSAFWIRRQAGKVASHSYGTGDFIPYLGGKKTLLVIEGKASRYDIVDDKIIVTVRKQDIMEVKKAIKAMYVKTVSDFMDKRVPFWCSELGLPVPEYGVNRAKGKWGVCYPQEKRLYLSYMCATLPEDLMDMTVLHEVCHLVHGGHGKDFWNLMQKHMPDLKERKAGLACLARSGWAMNIV